MLLRLLSAFWLLLGVVGPGEDEVHPAVAFIGEFCAVGRDGVVCCVRVVLGESVDPVADIACDGGRVDAGVVDGGDCLVSAGRLELHL